MNILVVRLGAMGDILHTLPAVSSLGRPVVWAVEPRWAPLLEGNPDVAAIVEIDRGQVQDTYRRLRARAYDVCIDFQGLIKSALVAAASGAPVVYGFDSGSVRERVAAVVYNRPVEPRATHVVDRNLELAQAAGGNPQRWSYRIPEGRVEGVLPERPFVLANPLAGWGGKQWPMENYVRLGAFLREAGFELVLNAPCEIEASGVTVHVSGLPGLIYATRRAAAVVGLDSGPVHLAAALGKPGVAIFGPTDPARNGPYGGSMTVLRTTDAETTYKRHAESAESMRAITAEQVWAALEPQLRR